MINVDNKVKNIYYMLCYSFYGDRLNQKDEALLGDEAFDNVYNLFSLLLCMLLKKQIKKGIHKDYNDYGEELNVVKGRINITKSIISNSLVKKKIFCDYELYDENCILNQVIKTTLYYLILSNKVGNKTKDKLKQLILYFKNVDIIDVHSIKWDSVKFNRNNIAYKYIYDICKLILKSLIVSEKDGKNKFKEFLDDNAVSSIYENFIKAYYRKHYPELNASSRKFYLTEDKQNSMIPIMRTDITIEYDNRMLIIDAKFYNKILHENRFNPKCRTVSSNHLFQIYAYVDSQDPQKKNGNVSGMLLYAQTINDPEVNIKSNIIGHTIFVNTLDMNSNWEHITEKLNIIANNFKSGCI